jgi:hypothetical protein
MERIFLRGDVRRSNERYRRNRTARDEPVQDLSTRYLRGHAKSLSIPDPQRSAVPPGFQQEPFPKG